MDQIDLNCDIGESFGAYKIGADEEILKIATSANIACGFHAGDPSTMHKTVKLALKNGVNLGAHPGLPDLIGFGRRDMAISPQEAYEIVVYQIGALYGFIKAEGGKLQHVKPHGALYNMAAKNPALSEAIAEAVYRVNPELTLFGLSGSELTKAGEKIGLPTAKEVFADRTYQQDGSLTPRSCPNALISDPYQATKQVLRMIKAGKADTVCIHGDGSHALLLAKSLRESLEGSGVKVQAIS